MFGLNKRPPQISSEVVNSPKSFGSPVFNFIRKRQNSMGSIAVDSPSPPKGDVGEIDTRAPFESVKAAVTLFREVGSPKSKPIVKKSTTEERVLEKETQHNMIIGELEFYKDRLRSAEKIKARALQDLQKANKTLQQLTDKIETHMESKQAAISETQAAKNRAKELEEKISIRAQLGIDSWKLDVDSERKRYKDSAGELNLNKQELTNLRQDLDAVIEARLAALQEVEESEQKAKLIQDKQIQLSKQVYALRQALDHEKLASLQIEEESLKILAEKEFLFLNYNSAKEGAEKYINRLKEEYVSAEILQANLEETSKGIKFLREQLNGIRSSDLHSLESLVLELVNAKKKLVEVTDEEKSTQILMDSHKLELEQVKRDRLELEAKALEAESTVKQMQADLERTKNELEQVISNNAYENIQLSIKNLQEEAEKDKHDAEELEKNTNLLNQEAEAAKGKTKEAEEKLQIALKQAEVAKAAVKLVDEKIYDSPRIDSGNLTDSSGSIRKITLSEADFELMKKKIEDIKREADVKVADALANVEAINANEKEVIKKLEAILHENEVIQSEIEDALKSAEMADAVKKVVEDELKKWRQEENEAVGPSNTSNTSEIHPE